MGCTGSFKVAIGQLEIWSGQAPILGQKAGIFGKYGITHEVFGTAGAGETVQAVISGSADFGVNVGTQGVLRAFAKGAPIRVIGANFTGAGDIFFYVRADSPIRSLKDTTERNTISYSTGGSTTHNIVLGLGKELGIKAVATSTGGMPATLTAVMSGQIDIGWGSPPFELKEIEEGKIRVVAGGNDVPSLRIQTIRVEVVNGNVLKNRNDAVLRFVRAFRETLDWMYADPEAIKMYAEAIKVPVAIARTAVGIGAEGGQAVRPHPGHRGDHGGRGQAQVSRRAAHQGATRGVHPNSAAAITAKSAESEETMIARNNWVCAAVLIAAAASGAQAEETPKAGNLKVAIGQLAWGGQAAVARPARRHLQEARHHARHFATPGGGETMQAVAGSADAGRDGRRRGAARLSQGAPVRVVGASFTGVGDLYWYVRADSRSGGSPTAPTSPPWPIRRAAQRARCRACLRAGARAQGAADCDRNAAGDADPGDVGPDRHRLGRAAVRIEGAGGGQDPHHRQRQRRALAAHPDRAGRDGQCQHV